MPKPKAPDPQGPQPDNWEPRHWLAYVPWATGTMTRQQIANHAGYSKGHIGTLIASWKRTWDVTDLTPRRPGITPEAQRKGVETHAVKARLTWAARQEGLANDIGNDVEEIRAFVRALVDHYREPERLATMSVPEAVRAGRDLVWMLRELTKVANQAAGIPDVTRALTIQATQIRFGESGPPDPGMEEDLLEDLLAGGAGTPQDVLDAIEVMAQGHLTEHAPGSLYEHVVEIHETDQPKEPA